MVSDLRVCFLGDSFVAGTGDPEHLGWAGRLAARTHRTGQSLTAYNLGVRRQTSAEVRQRWVTECSPRLPSSCDGRLVISFGVNDTTVEDGRQCVDTATSVANLTDVLSGARLAGWPALVIGPPPIADPAQNSRIEHLDRQLEDTATQLNVPYVSPFAALSQSSVWMRQVAAGDGAHPAKEGYAVLADLLWPPWNRWLASPGPQR
jgi:lysophospholipase L1-like esterase